MAQTATHTLYGTDVAALSTGLNSLANLGNLTTAAIDNTTNKNLYVDIYIKLNTQLSARTANAQVNVYLLGSPDGGTTYVDYRINVTALIGTISFDATTSALLEAAHDCPIPPGFFKLVFVNNTGQTLAATGSTMTALPHSVLST